MRAVIGSSSTPVTWLRPAQVLRHQRRKQARADAGLEHTSTTKAEPRHACPDCAHDVFGREMGVLGAAGERGVVRRADRRLQRRADLLPTVAEIIFARAPENAIGEFGCAEPVKRMSCACSSAVAER